MYRILIADDHPVIRKGLMQILADAGVRQPIEEASCGQEVLEKVQHARFDVVLLDISMPGMSGLETMDELKKLHPTLPVLILSIYPEEEYAVRALKSGALGYLTKKSAPDELMKAVRKAARGERYISAAVADILASNITGESERPLHASLSNRELQVFHLIVAGRSLKEIAAEMSLSPKTVSTFRTRILQKMHMQSNAELVRYSVENRLTG